jgi:hypothetical protein
VQHSIGNKEIQAVWNSSLRGRCEGVEESERNWNEVVEDALVWRRLLVQ